MALIKGPSPASFTASHIFELSVLHSALAAYVRTGDDYGIAQDLLSRVDRALLMAREEDRQNQLRGGRAAND